MTAPQSLPKKAGPALVTGGGSGIGLAIAQALAKAGAPVAISGRRADVLERACSEIDGDTLAITGDVSKPSDARRMVEETVARFGGLQTLVNNAAVSRGGPIEAMTDDTIDLVLDIDVKGPFYLTREALPHLRAHRDAGGAAVLNISSSVTAMALKNYSLYSAAKAALDMMTRCLALELAADRVRVNAILPGVVETPIFETMMPKEDVAGFLAGFDEAVPLGRPGKPEDVARVAALLCGPDSEWITGALIPVDGGLSLGPNT